MYRARRWLSGCRLASSPRLSECIPTSNLSIGHCSMKTPTESTRARPCGVSRTESGTNSRSLRRMIQSFIRSRSIGPMASGQPPAFTGTPGSVKGQVSMPSGTPSRSASSGHPFASTTEPAGVHQSALGSSRALVQPVEDLVAIGIQRAPARVHDGALRRLGAAVVLVRHAVRIGIARTAYPERRYAARDREFVHARGASRAVLLLV